MVCRSLNSCQQERLGEENALPLGGIKFPAKAKLLQSSVGSNNSDGAGREGKESAHRPHHLSSPEEGFSSLDEAGGRGRPPALGQRSPSHVCCAVVRWKELCSPSWSTSECCLPRLSLWVFSSIRGGCCYVVMPQLFLSCFFSSLSFAGSVPSRPADLPWAEMNSRKHTHTGFVSHTAHRWFWSGETEEWSFHL